MITTCGEDTMIDALFQLLHRYLMGVLVVVEEIELVVGVPRAGQVGVKTLLRHPGECQQVELTIVCSRFFRRVPTIIMLLVAVLEHPTCGE